MKDDDLLIPMKDEPPYTFDSIVGLIRDMLAGVGFIAMLVVIAFFFGYKS